MAATQELRYRPVDELIDSVRIDFQSFQSNGDIDNANLIKIAQEINYELGLRIHQLKETMLEVNNFKAKLPADYHQALLALSCYQWKQVQNAPWNGNVLWEEVTKNDIGHNTTDNPQGGCNPDPNTNGYNGPCCDICNVTHIGICPEVAINPYPMGKCRTLCNDKINIKILQYCESEVRCFEQFERLWLEPYKLASGFNTQGQFDPGYCNRGSISKGFLYTQGMECGKVYLYYLGAMEDDEGNLLVLDHPKINLYYEWKMKAIILENLWLNGEADIQNRMQMAQQKTAEYRDMALSIANMPNYRDVQRQIQILKADRDRQYYHTLSRYWGFLANPIDNYGHW